MIISVSKAHEAGSKVGKAFVVRIINYILVCWIDKTLYMDHYDNFLRHENVIICGDFNSNLLWKKKHGIVTSIHRHQATSLFPNLVLVLMAKIYILQTHRVIILE
ncbi:hypothetical protein N9Y26_01390 [bacterium]|nr:hypothetical protein [bacterium]